MSASSVLQPRLCRACASAPVAAISLAASRPGDGIAAPMCSMPRGRSPESVQLMTIASTARACGHRTSHAAATAAPPGVAPSGTAQTTWAPRPRTASASAAVSASCRTTMSPGPIASPARASPPRAPSAYIACSRRPSGPAPSTAICEATAPARRSAWSRRAASARNGSSGATSSSRAGTHPSATRHPRSVCAAPRPDGRAVAHHTVRPASRSAARARRRSELRARRALDGGSRRSITSVGIPVLAVRGVRAWG
jgi:hypothetical protein